MELQMNNLSDFKYRVNIQIKCETNTEIHFEMYVRMQIKVNLSKMHIKNNFGKSSLFSFNFDKYLNIYFDNKYSKGEE